jgi:predicted hydrocarbon binding protein
MHGVIFSALKKFCGARLGASAWEKVLQHSNMAGRLFLTADSYPDGDALALIDAICRVTHADRSVVLEDFGDFLAPELMTMYAALIRSEWRTFDLLLNTENTIHRIVRMRDKGARPPQLRCEANDEHQLTIYYTSERRLCALAIGLIRGVGRHYGEPVSIVERTCMLRGAPACEFVVRR